MTTHSESIGWTLWSGTVGFSTPVQRRIEAAAAAGYRRLSLSPSDIAQLEAQGTSPAELRKRARDAGLDIIVDPIVNWYTERPRVSTSEWWRYSAEEILRLAENVDAVAISVMANLGPAKAVAADDLVEPLVRLCDAAGGFGAQIQLEFIPMTEVPTLATAWQIVQAADRPNAGLVFDMWHFFRGTPDFELLRRLPGDRIFALQLDDADADVHGTMLQDTYNRKLPGAGSFDLARALRVLAEIGALNWVGPEVISPELHAFGPEQAAQVALQRCRDVIELALATTLG